MRNTLDAVGSCFDAHTDLHGSDLRKLASTIESHADEQVKLVISSPFNKI